MSEVAMETVIATEDENEKEHELKRGFLFGLGFWTAGVLVMFVPFAAVLFAVYYVITTML
ncbi:MAG: hypothetical protein NUK65_03800 [Firmicutes bacterium]|nr:hypothetical protein [Bacillota bacterium]